MKKMSSWKLPVLLSTLQLAPNLNLNFLVIFAPTPLFSFLLKLLVSRSSCLHLDHFTSLPTLLTDVFPLKAILYLLEG